MASIEIPSLPTADLNNMLNLVVKQAGGIWSGGGTTTVTYATVADDNDLSPEPRTPKFDGSSTPSFAESNAQFGFTFPRSETRLSGDSSGVPVTNVSFFVSEAQSRLSNTSSSNPQPQHEGMEVETTSKETPAQYVLVHESAGTDYTQTQISSSPELGGPEINIPTTVLDKVGETRSRHSMVTGKPHPSELPTIMLASGDGKPASYIRFLNDPIPMPIHYEHQEVDIDKYRKPLEDIVKTDPSVPVDTKVLSDIDAIQRMEREHVYLEPTNNYHYSTTDQCVPPTDQNPGSENSLYSESSDECSSNSLPAYHNDSDVMINDVAAYQSVEETPTYIELKTRPTPPPPTPYPQQVHQRPTYTQCTNESAESSYSETEMVKQPSVDRPVVSISLKDGLKQKIQLKRLQEGKGQLKVSFENRPLGEPTEEEKRKAETRKQKNRDSAVKSRERRQIQMTNLEKEVKALERENKILDREVRALKEDISQIKNIECEVCLNTADQQELFARSVNHGNEQSNSQSFKGVLSAFLAEVGHT